MKIIFTVSKASSEIIYRLYLLHKTNF